jgi:DNA processing protein
MFDSLRYQIALTLIPNIGPVQAKILLQHYEAEEIFKTKTSLLERIEGIGTIRANNIKAFDDFKVAEDEIAFIEKYKIRPLFLTDPDYPQRLLNCYDSPTLLYYRGEANLNASRIIAVIGTRNNTEYGKHITETLIADLAALDVTVVSGLAYGIDAIAHKASLKNNLPTIGVLAHGLDQVYPSQHAGFAKDMIKHRGGLLTEFRSATNPDKHNFPTRNRIVAGMSDVTVVIETGVKGGSMITAELANGYNKDVFAVPGRANDSKSSGSNHLIRNNKAILLTDAEQLIDWMGWEETAGRLEPGAGSHQPGAGSRKLGAGNQKELFIELSNEEKIIVEILKEKEAAHIDEINLRSGLSSSTVAAAILNLELQNVVLSQPGKRYSLQ